MIAYLIGCLALCISPGPDMLFLISRTLSHGRVAGLAALAGVVSGATVHLIVAALGLSVAIGKAPILLAVLTVSGGAYLVFLGIATIHSGVGELASCSTAAALLPAWKHFRQGFITDVLNPKVALFYVVFIPPFVDPQSDNKALEILGLGIVLNTVGILVNGTLVLFADRAAAVFRSDVHSARWISRVAGVTLILIGIVSGVRGVGLG